MTLAPWKSGCLLVWDATCPDTLALSYRAHAIQEPGKVTAAAEERKSEKYRGLPPGHMFSPIAIADNARIHCHTTQSWSDMSVHA